ncbi:Ferredoxin subunit of nitrite reductase or a ring-hydroxylating dioxygenase [Bryocella elongata]|uniref:Ferredoxin subunit of nitrite reductase or a ring-hydroxylating dioxygenase n=1 Tax=Bryocella elongata TaxID=863522 RepID=A0A1H6CC00_9BACT|nr:Rieske (2Fe-2S) protein [Bryocella elongata]SEG70373.1 Ferredoxin subunit of nitrite reductase or a ring-hydroxylating dioxygenase [Bryocella elongata]
MSDQHWVTGPLVSEIPEARPLRGKVSGKDVLFVRAGDEIRCLLDECPHMGLSMARAEIASDHTFSCPWHGMVFNALTGECVSSPGEHLKMFPVQVEGGRVQVKG